MSTLIASNKTISAIVRYAIINEITVTTADDWAIMTADFGQVMLEYNALAFNTCYAHWATYTDEQKAMGYVLADVDTMKFELVAVEPANLEPAAIVKLCYFYDYQACEIDGYRGTLIARTIDKIREHAIAELDGYVMPPFEPLSRGQINQLLDYICREHVVIYHDQRRFGDYCMEGLDLIGIKLLESMGIDDPDFTHEIFCERLAPMDVINLCNQWYCRTGSRAKYDGTPADSIITRLREFAIDRLPVYKQADWGI